MIDLLVDYADLQLINLTNVTGIYFSFTSSCHSNFFFL